MSDYFYNPINRDLSMVQGDTMSFGFQLQGLKGERPDAVYFSCKEKIEDEDYLFQVTLSDNIDFRSYDSDKDILTYGVRIPPALTQYLPLGRYFYDLQVRVNYDTITLMIGRLEILYQVTMSTTPTPAPIANGDLVEYPREITDPSLEKKYTEKYISDIATAINLINGNTAQEIEGSYTVGYDDIQSNQMSYYLGTTFYNLLLALNSKVNEKAETEDSYQGISDLTSRINSDLDKIYDNGDSYTYPLDDIENEQVRITVEKLNDIAYITCSLLGEVEGSITNRTLSEIYTQLATIVSRALFFSSWMNSVTGETVDYSGVEDLFTRARSDLDKKYPNGTEVYY